MTTYVLHGGAISKNLPSTADFYTQFTQLVPKQEVKILLCYWARKKEEWEKLVKRDTQKITQQCEKKVFFHVVEDVADLFAQIKDFDVLYVSGGDAEPIEKFYPDLVNLKKELSGKVYIGSSMGAFLASKRYVLSPDSQDTYRTHDGVGLLPIQVLCHWNLESEKQRKLDLLDTSVPVLVLDEGQFSVLYGD